jgi:hypothetical protein
MALRNLISRIDAVEGPERASAFSHGNVGLRLRLTNGRPRPG